MKSTKNLIAYAAMFLLASLVFISCRKDKTEELENSNAYKPSVALAKTNNELKVLRENPNSNVVKTLEQFDAVVNNTPLVKLSQEARAAFRKSLVVRENVGIVSLAYGDIQQHLTYDEFAVVMSLFGLDVKGGFWGFSKDPSILRSMNEEGDEEEETTPSDGLADHIDYYCITRANCAKNKKNICLSGC